MRKIAPSVFALFSLLSFGALTSASPLQPPNIMLSNSATAISSNAVQDNDLRSNTPNYEAFPPPPPPSSFFYQVPYSDIWIHFLPQLPPSGSFNLTDMGIVIRDAIRDSMDPFRPDTTMPTVPQEWVSGEVTLKVLPSPRARGQGPTLTYGRWISALTGFNGFVHAYPEVAYIFGLWVDDGSFRVRERVATGAVFLRRGV